MDTKTDLPFLPATQSERKTSAPPSCAVSQGSAIQEPRYNWQIEIVAEREEETGLLVPFIGTHREASAKADRLADGAPYDVRECVLHRRGEISSPNVADQPRPANGESL